MKQNIQRTMRRQVQEDLGKISKVPHILTPKVGWIQTIRLALGMSSGSLARRLGCSQPNVITLEKREKAGTISIEKLRQAAEAMDCQLVYFIVPKKSIDQLREERARAVAKKRIRMINHSMKLEHQGLTTRQIKQQVNDVTQELLQTDSKKLWRDDDI